MPIAVALALRAIVQFALTFGAVTLAEKFMLPPLNAALAAIVEFFGVSDEVAQDIFTNEFLIWLEEVGIGSALVRSKLPLAVSNRLGLTSKGFVPRVIPTAGPTLPKAPLPVAGTIAPAVSTAVRNVTASTPERAKAYSDSLDALLAKLAIDEKIAGAKAAQTTPGKIMDFITGAGGAYSLATIGILGTLIAGVNKLTAPKGVVYMTSTDGSSSVNAQVNGEAISLPAASVALAAQATTPVLSVTPPVIVAPKVFVGIISAGTLGGKVDFVPRPDDLITSVEELTDAARNNLAGWLSGLLGRIIYEIKIVPSVITKSGVTIHGTTSKVISSYTAKGVPRYKNVVNRFAVMNLYIIGEGQKRVKIATVVLGPTDAQSFRPSIDELAKATTDVQGSVTTTSVADIKTIATSVQVAVVPPTTATPPVGSAIAQPTPTPTPVVATPSPAQSSGLPVGFRSAGTQNDGTNIYTANDGNVYNSVGVRLVQHPPSTLWVLPSAPVTAPVAVASPFKPGVPKFNYGGVCTAGNLTEFYNAKAGFEFSLAQRAAVYQSAGLGPAGTYTGTYSQNVALLAKLQGFEGCN